MYLIELDWYEIIGKLSKTQTTKYLHNRDKYKQNKYISLQHLSSVSLSKEMHARLIGFTVDFKLHLGVNVSVCGCRF